MSTRKKLSMAGLGAAVVASGTAIFVSSAHASSFRQIRIGDVDGFGFGDGAGLYGPNGSPVNLDGAGVLGTGDFLPDLNGGGFVRPSEGDDFDHRSVQEKNNSSVTGSGFTNITTTGSRFTDVSLSTSYNPNGKQDLRFEKANLVFDFFVDSADIIPSVPLFFNLIYGDLGLPGKAIFTRWDGSKFEQSLSVIDHDNGEDGLILAAFAEIAFDDVFTLSEDGTGFHGYLEANFITNEKIDPYVTLDYAEIGTRKIRTTPESVPEPSAVLGLLAFGAAGSLGSLLKRKPQRKADNSSDS